MITKIDDCLLGPFPHLPTFSFQPSHSFLTPLLLIKNNKKLKFLKFLIEKTTYLGSHFGSILRQRVTNNTVQHTHKH